MWSGIAVLSSNVVYAMTSRCLTKWYLQKRLHPHWKAAPSLPTWVLDGEIAQRSELLQPLKHQQAMKLEPGIAKEKKRKEKKRKEKATSFDVNVMRSQVSYWAASDVKS